MFNPERTFSPELKELLKQPSKKLIRIKLSREDALSLLMCSFEIRRMNATIITKFQRLLEDNNWEVKKDFYLTIEANSGHIQDGTLRVMAFLRSTNTEFETYIKLV